MKLYTWTIMDMDSFESFNTFIYIIQLHCVVSLMPAVSDTVIRFRRHITITPDDNKKAFNTWTSQCIALSGPPYCLEEPHDLIKYEDSGMF